MRFATDNMALFFQRELQVIETTIFTRPRPPLKAEQLIPVDTSIPPGASEWGFDRIQEVGFARWASANPRDMPRVGVRKERALFPMATAWDGYSFTWDDLQKARMTGLPLDPTLALAARRVLEEMRNRVWLRGAPEKSFVGFINDPFVPVTTPIVGDWDGTNGSVTPQQILEAMHAAVETVKRNSLETFEPDTMVLPLNAYSYISTTPLGNGSDMTIRAHFLANSDQIRNITPLLELETAGAGGTGRAVIYRRDPEVLEAKASVLFEAQPPQTIGLETQVALVSKIGGVAWKEPIAAVYVDGVTDAP